MDIVGLDVNEVKAIAKLELGRIITLANDPAD